MASVLVPGKAVGDRIGLADAMAIPIKIEIPVSTFARQREAELVEAACRGRLRRLDTATFEQLHRILGYDATPLHGVITGAAEARVREGLGGGSEEGGGGGVVEPTITVFGATNLQEAKERTTISERAVIEALSPGGAIDGVMGGYEARPGQIKMAQAVARSLNDGLCAVIEAGTGTGKSLAYLVPAAMYAVANGRRVVISTHTVNLQDQLVGKDIPVLRRALPHDVQVAVLKGRAHYLCIRRWRSFLRSGLAGPDERVIAARIVIWLRTTDTGDRNELALDDTEAAIWTTHLSADLLHCTSRLCPENRGGKCFLSRARRRAAGAHLLIVNHALLLTDRVQGAGAERGVLPEYREVIIDEAHHLEGVATDHLGAQVGTRDLLNAVAAVSTSMGSGRYGGIVSRIAATYVEVAGTPGRDLVGELTTPIHTSCSEAREAVPILREAILTVLDRGGRPGSDRELRLTTETRTGEQWSAVVVAWEFLARQLLDVERGLRALAAAFDPFIGAHETVDDAVAELQSAMQMVGEAGRIMAEVITTPNEGADEVTALGRVHWVSPDRLPGGREITLHTAPLEVDRLLQSVLFEEVASIILTSATMQVDGSFGHVRARLGLTGPNTHTLHVASPFDYQAQALLVVPRDLPDPSAPALAPMIHDLLRGIASAMGGRTLVLFTSYVALRAAHEYLTQELPHLTVLGQGVDGPRGVILERFRRTPNAILLGTNSFWEGIDVVGDALSCLVIQKLPFAVPTDPIFAARSELLEDPFGQLAVPQAVVRMKQGFGRLIRSATDRGVVVVLDSRLVTRSYGKVFLNSMPPASRRICQSGEVVGFVDEWIRAGRHR